MRWPRRLILPALVLACLAPGARAAEAPAPPPATNPSPPAVAPTNPPPAAPAAPRVLVHRVDYAVQLAEDQARVDATYDVELLDRGRAAIALLEGDVALPAQDLPRGVRLEREGPQYRLVLDKARRQRFRLAFTARVSRAEPWLQTAFAGPSNAAIAAVEAVAPGRDVDLQFPGGTVADLAAAGDTTRLRGFLGPARAVTLRWRGKTAAAARATLLTCDAAATVHVAPAVIKCATVLRYAIVQGTLPRLEVEVPPAHALTRLEGAQIRDWQVRNETNRQVLAVEFIKPLEKECQLTLFTEQTVDGSPVNLPWTLPCPLGVDRETGRLVFGAEDMVVEAEGLNGLRQVEAGPETLLAYQFHARPCGLTLRLRRIDPELAVADRVTLRLEEARVLAGHALALKIEKAGIYQLELAPLAGFTVADVKGRGIEDWRAEGDRLKVVFARRVLGALDLAVQLERPLAGFTNRVAAAALRLAGAAKEEATVGAAAAPGLRLRTQELAGLREIPVAQLGGRTDEGLAFTAEKPDWSLTLAADRLDARVLAEVFNLVTVGEGVVGGSATIRYAILNQGVQELRVRVPAHWKNVDFTGPGIRRKDQQGDVWTLSLQEKAWGGYTLVVTYDFAFDPRQATLALGGIHALDVERETGTLALGSVPSLQLREKTVSAASPAQIFRIDETELAATDRALLAHAVLLAYRYSGGAYDLAVDVTRFKPVSVLQAVADLTQLTTVLTQEGQLLTQASFMIKNNEKQFQRFTLPPGAEFWACYADGEAARPERDGADVLVPLPRDANRDEAHPVEIVYAEKAGDLRGPRPRPVALAAPRTDVQTTFARWQVYVPPTHTLARFGGSMTVARGTRYGLREAWNQFTRCYDRLYVEFKGLALFVAFLAGCMALLVLAIRRRWRGLVALLVVGFVGAILLGLLLPAMSGARERARRVQMMAEVADQQAAPEPPASAAAPAEDAGVVAEANRDEPRGELKEMDAVEQTKAPVQIRGLYASRTVGRPAVQPPAQPPAKVAGVRSLRIDVPRTGTPFEFTKVLDIRGEPLTVAAVAVKTTALSVAQGAAMLAVFALGLLLLVLQFRRPAPSSLVLAIGFSLILGSATALCLVARLLGAVFVALPPLAAAAAFAWWIRRLRRRRRERDNPFRPQDAIPPAPDGVIAGLLLAVLLGANAAAAPTGDVAIAAASYTGAIQGDVARLRATLDLDARRLDRGAAEAVLFGSDVAVAAFRADARRVELVRDNGRLLVRFARRTDARVDVELVARVGGDAARRTLAFAAPAALASRLTLTLPEADAQVEVPAAVSFRTTPDGAAATRVEAVFGAAERIEVAWVPRVKRAAETAAMVFCDNAAAVRVGEGVVNVRAALAYQLTQGERREARVLIPAGQRVLRVEGAAVRTWDLKAEGGTNILAVAFAQGVTSNCTLTVETEQPLAALPMDLAVAVPHALDVKRENGLVAFGAGEEVGLTATRADGAQKVEVEEYARALAAAGVTAAADAARPGMVYRFLRPDFALALRVEPVQPRIEAAVLNHIVLGHERIAVAARVAYEVKKAGVFALRLALPPGYAVTGVDGERVAQWAEKDEAGQRVLTVRLKERTLGATALTVNLYQWVPKLPDAIGAAGVRPLDAAKVTGFVKVGTELGIQAKARAFEGLTEVPAADVADVAAGGGALAYKLRPDAAAPWTLALTTEVVEPWVRAEVVNVLTLNAAEPGLAQGRATVRFDVQNAPVREFRLRVPASFRNVDIAGGNIRRRDQSNDVWRIELQSRVAGAVAFTVTWEQAYDPAKGQLDARGVAAVGAERETGAVAIEARPPLQVSERAADGELARIDERELPDWAARGGAPAVLAYRYLRPGWALGVGVQRFENAAVLNALVDSARLVTVIAEDGQSIGEASLSVRNNARQYLEVALPAGAQLWSAFVDGQAVRPSRRGERLLVPLRQGRGEGEVNRVEVVYVGDVRFPARRGPVALATPAFDVPLKNATLELYLPPDYAYGSFAGTMMAAPEEVARRRALSFSMDEYLAWEGKKKAARAADMSFKLSQAKQKLAGNELNDANLYYQEVRQSAYDSDAPAAKGDLKKLESQLRKAQASNVLAGQRSFVRMNAAAAGPGFAPMQQMEQGQGADEEVAAKQYDRLQQAQELAVAKVQPLHVNLPRRGLRFVFAQPLQTEVGQPMTVTFRAVNVRGVSVPLGLAVAAAGFAALWAVAFLAVRRRRA